MRGDEGVQTLAIEKDRPVPEIAANGQTRREILVRTGMFGAAVSLSGILAACGGSGSGTTGSAAQSGDAGGTASNAEVDRVTMGYIGVAPPSLDVASAFSLAGLVPASLGLESLLETDTDLKLKPSLAKGWSQPDPTHYVFDLRPGVKFWNGAPLTVEDAAFSIERHLDESVGSQIGFLLESIKSVETQGDSRIILNLAKPDPVIPQVLTFVPIMPKAAIEKAGDKLGAPGSAVNVVGTGSYEITSFSTEGGVEVRRNENYWGKKPKVKAATIKYFESPQTMLLAARAGSIDGGFEFIQSEAATWNKVSGLNTEFPEGLGSYFLCFDMESEPWNDIHVRRAVAHCCDREGYVKAFMAGEATAATSVVPKAQWANVAGSAEVDALYETFRQYPFDVDAAKAELAKSAYPDGFSATVTFYNSRPMLGKALVSLSETLKQIGIDLEVKVVSETQWLTTVVEHKNLGIQSFLYLPDYNDPSNYPMVLFPSANAVENAFNVANFKNPKVDRLLEEQAATTDKKERAELLGEVLSIVAEEVPYFPIWWQGSTLALNDEFVLDGFNSLYYFQPWLDDMAARA